MFSTVLVRLSLKLPTPPTKARNYKKIYCNKKATTPEVLYLKTRYYNDYVQYKPSENFKQQNIIGYKNKKKNLILFRKDDKIQDYNLPEIQLLKNVSLIIFYSYFYNAWMHLKKILL